MLVCFEPTLAGRTRRMRFWRWPLGAVALIIMVVGALFLRARTFDAGALPRSLTQDAAIPVVLPDGRQVRLHELVRPGRPTVISLWASWCGPCRREAPAIVDLRRRMGDRINLLYLNVRDQAASQGDLTRYMREVGLPADGYARMNDRHIGNLTGSADVLVPRTLVFDRNGAPLARITGFKPLALGRVAGMVEE